MESKEYLLWLKKVVMDFYKANGLQFNYKMLAVMIFQKHFLGALKSNGIQIQNYLDGRIQYRFEEMVELTADHIGKLLKNKKRPYKMELSIWKHHGICIYLHEKRTSCGAMTFKSKSKWNRKKAIYLGRWNYVAMQELPVEVKQDDFVHVLDFQLVDKEFQKYLKSYDEVEEKELVEFLKDVKWDDDDLLSDWKGYIEAGEEFIF